MSQYVYKLKQDSNFQPNFYDGMKNVMVFVTTNLDNVSEEVTSGWEHMKDDDYFDKTIRFIKAQIDNSLELNWKPEDIILATNFDFEYKGVKSYILEKTCNYSQFFNKEYAIYELLDKGIIKDTNLFYHDLDAFQLTEFEFPKFNGDWGTCVYPKSDGHSCQCGVMYIKPSALDIFKQMVDIMEVNGFTSSNDEVVIRGFVKQSPEFGHRVSVLDTSWNVGMSDFKERYNGAIQPLKVVHFHPDDRNQYDTMVEGKNELNVKIVNDRLLSIIKRHDLC